MIEPGDLVTVIGVDGVARTDYHSPEEPQMISIKPVVGKDGGETLMRGKDDPLARCHRLTRVTRDALRMVERLTSADIEQFDRVSAVFNPLRTDDLAPGAAEMIGQRFTFTADYRIDEGFPHEGDWHMTLSREDYDRTGIFWVPGCDLTDIEWLR